MRDLTLTPQPVLDEAALGALFTPADKRSPEQAARVALDDALIAEIQALRAEVRSLQDQQRAIQSDQQIQAAYQVLQKAADMGSI
mgnify:CR=1 FL=1